MKLMAQAAAAESSQPASESETASVDGGSSLNTEPNREASPQA